MLKSKYYQCQIPNCSNKVKIRSTIKNNDSEYYGLKACPRCTSKYNKKQKSEQTRRTEAKRREERKDFPEFFQRHIEIARNKHCAECGTKLTGHVSEIAHLISKTSVGGNPELATEDSNVVYLCGMYSDKQCHSKYDSSLESRENMKVFTLALERFELLKDEIMNWNTSEVRHYLKHLDKK